jgi:hypothetical protein
MKTWNSSEPNAADGSGGKSDPPVGTGRGLKLRASKAAERGRSEYPGGLVSILVRRCNHHFFGLAIFSMHPISLLGGRKAPKRNMLAAAYAGLATNQIA